MEEQEDAEPHRVPLAVLVVPVPVKIPDLDCRVIDGYDHAPIRRMPAARGDPDRPDGRQTDVVLRDP